MLIEEQFIDYCITDTDNIAFSIIVGIMCFLGREKPREINAPCAIATPCVCVLLINSGVFCVSHGFNSGLSSKLSAFDEFELADAIAVVLLDVLPGIDILSHADAHVRPAVH